MDKKGKRENCLPPFSDGDKQTETDIEMALERMGNVSERIFAMIPTRLKGTADAYVHAKVSDAVITKSAHGGTGGKVKKQLWSEYEDEDYMTSQMVSRRRPETSF